jgi:hypothetical protein
VHPPAGWLSLIADLIKSPVVTCGGAAQRATVEASTWPDYQPVMSVAAQFIDVDMLSEPFVECSLAAGTNEEMVFTMCLSKSLAQICGSESQRLTIQSYLYDTVPTLKYPAPPKRVHLVSRVEFDVLDLVSSSLHDY